MVELLPLWRHTNSTVRHVDHARFYLLHEGKQLPLLQPATPSPHMPTITPKSVTFATPLTSYESPMPSAEGTRKVPPSVLKKFDPNAIQVDRNALGKIGDEDRNLEKSCSDVHRRKAKMEREKLTKSPTWPQGLCDAAKTTTPSPYSGIPAKPGAAAQPGRSDDHLHTALHRSPTWPRNLHRAGMTSLPSPYK